MLIGAAGGLLGVEVVGAVRDCRRHCPGKSRALSRASPRVAPIFWEASS